MLALWGCNVTSCLINHSFIHSSIIHNCLSSAGSRAEANLSWQWERAGSSQGWHVETSNHSHSHHTYGQFRVTTRANLHVFGLWEEAGVSGENLRRHRENIQTPHRKVQPQLGIKARSFLLWGGSANRWATVMILAFKTYKESIENMMFF